MGSSLPGPASPALDLLGAHSDDLATNLRAAIISNALRTSVILEKLTGSTIGAIGNLCTVNAIVITERPRVTAVAPGGDVILAGSVAVNVDVPVLRRDGRCKDQEEGHREELHCDKSCVTDTVFFREAVECKEILPWRISRLIYMLCNS